MIPSDHFVRFYNEVFKFLEAEGEEALHEYWLAISRNQEAHTLELFREKGLEGMEEYWSRIREEENCELSITRSDTRFELRMHECPSLGKAMDNDAGAMGRYCDHCAGWIGPIMDKLGYHLAYDAIDRTRPQCVIRVFTDPDDAAAADREAALPMGWPGKTSRNG